MAQLLDQEEIDKELRKWKHSLARDAIEKIKVIYEFYTGMELITDNLNTLMGIEDIIKEIGNTAKFGTKYHDDYKRLKESHAKKMMQVMAIPEELMNQD